MKKLLLFIIANTLCLLSFSQVDSTITRPKYWKKTITFGLSYNHSKLTNPPVGYGINQAGGNVMVSVRAFYDKKKNFSKNFMDWTFGLLRLGSGPLEPGSDQKIPFQKTIDFLKITSFYGRRISKDSTFSLLGGFDIQTQATASYADSEGKVRGLFLKDIRDSETNPIQSRFFAPAYFTAYVLGIGYNPSPKLFIGYSPATYKGILVLDDQVASLAGEVDANGQPIASIHGNKVERVNGVAVFKNSFNQFGSYLLANYNDRFFKGKFGVSSKLGLYSNYLNKPEQIDVWWQNRFSFNLVKGLSLAYMINVFYDNDVLVALTDESVPGGFSGELGRKAAMQRQLMLQYQIVF